MLYQQGDVLFEKCSSIPKNLPEIKDRIVAVGEATGHFHQVVGAKVFGNVDAEERFVDVLQDGAHVAHQEHNTISLPPGKYKVRKVREYDHFLEEARSVAD